MSAHTHFQNNHPDMDLAADMAADMKDLDSDMERTSMHFQFLFRLLVHNLPPNTRTHFQIYALLPPHCHPHAVHLDLNHNHNPQASSARFSFDAHSLDQVLSLWNHVRLLTLSGHLDPSVVVELDPPLHKLLFLFEACKSIFPTPPNTFVPFVHISNLSLGTSAHAIQSHVIPPDLVPHVQRVLLHDMGPSLSPPFPEPDRARRLVGRATVLLDTPENALALFKHVQAIRQLGLLNRFRHFGANAPFAPNPMGLIALMQARRTLGDHAIQAMLTTAMREPQPAVHACPFLPLSAAGVTYPTPTPSSASSSTRSKTPSPPPPATRRQPSPLPHSRASSVTRTRPPQPSPYETYAPQPRGPFVQRHYTVTLENICPEAPAAVLESLAADAPTSAPPFKMHVSHGVFHMMLAFQRVATRTVIYAFDAADDADTFFQYVRRLDRQDALHGLKAEPSVRLSVFQKIVQGDQAVGW